jgi:hypothetical protein
LKKDIEAFIVRIWQEAENMKGRGDIWRGSIVHVGSNRQLYFYNLESIARFIRENTEGQADESSGGSQRQADYHWQSSLKRIYERICDIRTKIWHWHTGRNDG